MSRHCIITQKKVASGNNVSHAHNKTKRRFFPNLQSVSFYCDDLKERVRLSISTHGLRTIEHHGGIEAWLRRHKPSDPTLLRLKKRLQRIDRLKETKAKKS